MMELGEVLNEYETKINVTLETKNYLFKIVEQNKEIRKRAIKAIEKIREKIR